MRIDILLSAWAISEKCWNCPTIVHPKIVWTAVAPISPSIGSLMLWIEFADNLFIPIKISTSDESVFCSLRSERCIHWSYIEGHSILLCDKLISGTIKTSNAWIITLEDDFIVNVTTSDSNTTELLKFPKHIFSFGTNNFNLFASARLIIVASLPGSKRENGFTQTSPFNNGNHW